MTEKIDFSVFRNIPTHELLLRGQSAMEVGDFRSAAQLFELTIALNPGKLALIQLGANAWRLAGDMLAEKDLWKRAASMGDAWEPDDLYKVGAELLRTGSPTQAALLFERVREHRPRDPAVLGALASARRSTGDLPRAFALVDQAVRLAPKNPAFALTMAQVLHAQGQLATASHWLRRALALRPGHRPTLLQRAFTRLLEGPTAKGWADFESRDLPSAPTSARRWNGEALAGESIMVLAEQGLGDLFHFIRFVPRLAESGAGQIVVAAAPSVVPLLSASGFTAVAITEAPETSWYVPIMSLPHHLGQGTQTDARRVPYLRTGREAHLATEAIIGRKPRIGIAWQGNPAFTATELRDFDRTLLPALLDVDAFDWVSLQLGSPHLTERLAPCPPWTDWLETARYLQTLDAVVTVDTAIAHVAGGLGLPTYILLPFSPDWRWGLERSQCIWYPSVTLVRQAAPNDWQSVVDQLYRLLSEFQRTS